MTGQPWYTRFTKETQDAAQRTMIQRGQRKPPAPAENEFDRMVPPTQSAQAADGGVGPAHLTTAKRALQFITGGNALFTLRSKKTGERYTYKVVRSKPDPKKPTVYFVKLLAGPDNTGDYVYIGMLTAAFRRNGPNDGFLHFVLTGKSKMKEDSKPVQAIQWTIEKLARGVEFKNLEIWHAGRCGRCGRTLTVPSSIADGFGPECAGKVGL